MDILLVRHGESEGNLARLMQGSRDYPLSDTGRAQARQLGAWLIQHAIGWDQAYVSPLARAKQTAEVLSEVTGLPQAVPDDDLAELSAGTLEGLTREEMQALYPSFLQRAITELGDFGEFGGESYDAVQQRACRLLDKLERLHRAAALRVLLVGHGGINFQLVKILVCEPVPRVCILRMGNCTATMVRMRERRGRYMGEIAWHVPIELMGGASADGIGGAFR
jgi:broad specificity phosphatase PhoE